MGKQRIGRARVQGADPFRRMRSARNNRGLAGERSVHDPGPNGYVALFLVGRARSKEAGQLFFGFVVRLRGARVFGLGACSSVTDSISVAAFSTTASKTSPASVRA